MPVLHFPLERLQRALGKEVDLDTLRREVPQLGCALDKSDGPAWAVEIFPDRPDLLSVELLGRAMRAYLGLEPGLSRYELAKPATTLRIDGNVEAVRPHVVAGMAHGLDLTDEDLVGLMELQEDLHWGLGARRRKVSVGVHDARDIEPPFTYKAVDPDTVSFVPLHDDRSLTMREMVTDLEKGRAYAHLVEGHDAWPLIVDAREEILSFPPIINGTLTTLREGTRDVLVDVTGTDRRAADRVLAILMAHLAELGGELEAVTLEGPGGTEVTPELEPTRHTARLSRARSLLGIELPGEEALEALRKMGHDASLEDDLLTVEVGPWRADILHEVDLIEDVGIGIGFHTFAGTSPREVTFGAASPAERFADKVRRALTGLGYLECMTLTLTSAEEQTTRFGAEDPVVAMENPESSENAVGRNRLLPGLLTLAGRNVHRDLPQRLFEVGDVLLPQGDERPRNERRVAGLVVAPDAGFTGIKSHVEALLSALGMRFREEAGAAPGFVEGRCAVLDDPETERVLGHYGEIDPAVITAFGLGNPCAGFELTLRPLPSLETWGPESEEDEGLRLRGT